MENIDVIIFSCFVGLAFIVFIVTSVKEFSKMSKKEYVYNPEEKKFGRNAIYNLLEKVVSDPKTNMKEKIALVESVDRVLADMHTDGVYFTEEVKEKLEYERDKMYCKYSGLPSPKAYEKIKV